jgi:hypothetical protein
MSLRALAKQSPPCEEIASLSLAMTEDAKHFLDIAFFLHRYIIEMSICPFGGVIFWQEGVVVAW